MSTDGDADRRRFTLYVGVTLSALYDLETGCLFRAGENEHVFFMALLQLARTGGVVDVVEGEDAFMLGQNEVSGVAQHVSILDEYRRVRDEDWALADKLDRDAMRLQDAARRIRGKYES